MVYKIVYALSLLLVTCTDAAHKAEQQQPFFYFKTTHPQFSGCDEIALGQRESLIYAFHAEHEDTALFLTEHLKEYIAAIGRQPVAITNELCTIMQKALGSFLQKHEDPFNLELQRVAITFFHPHRNNVSIHHIECNQGTFKQVDTIYYKNICDDPKRLFISVLTHSQMPNELLLASLHQIENNELTKKVAAKDPNKLLKELLGKDNNIKGLIALSGYSWLKNTHSSFTTHEYQQLAKKFRAKQLGKNYRFVKPIEKSILMHAQDTQEQLLQFAAQLRANDQSNAPQFALDFLDDAIEEKREQENQAQQTSRLLCFINLIPS